MKKTYIIIVIILVVFTIIYYLKNISNNDEIENIYIESNNEVQSEEISTIKVHVIGEVLNPGIYEIESGSRVDDLIKKAGGTTENTDLNKVNLAYEISDGEKIYIPSIFDEENEYTLSSDSQNKKININKATAEELQSINGIGESLANRIINYRNENGKFANIEDLKNVSGIGDKKFESIKEYIVVK